jgi:hypothetical protein
MFMSNIPRRKIYEEMLILEENILNLQVLTISEKNFKEFKDEYGKVTFDNLKDSYQKIKSLFILFLENKIFDNEQEFESEFNYYIHNEKDANQILKKSKVINKKFKECILDLDKIFDENTEIKSSKDAKKLFDLMDIFNTHIPKILEIRREKIMNKK